MYKLHINDYRQYITCRLGMGGEGGTLKCVHQELARGCC